MVDALQEPVIYEVRGEVAHVTLNQPENRNALTKALMAGIRLALTTMVEDDDVRLCVLTNTPPAFCAGADLSNPGAGSNRDLADLLELISDSPKPIIARINGFCLGGGIGIAASCDLSIATTESIFGFSEVRVGVAPAIISVYCLPKLRRVDALELFLTGARFDAAKATEVGLITRVGATGEVDSIVEEWIANILLGGPRAIATAKRMIYEVAEMSREDALEKMTLLSAELFGSQEAQEGITAFREKRRPSWNSPTSQETR
jgi:methylglutaconyl-CoA hydratase